MPQKQHTDRPDSLSRLRVIRRDDIGAEHKRRAITINDLTAYHKREAEKERVSSLLSLIPDDIGSILDVGVRDGFITRLLVEHCTLVTALDLEVPAIEHPRIRCVKGDLTALDFPDKTFDLCFCAEVLEHVPMLSKACSELSRVSRLFILLGVPFDQDIRVAKTTCLACGQINPPWGHVNVFVERKEGDLFSPFQKHSITELFPDFQIIKKSFVGVSTARTNWFSSTLYDAVGNPWGTYDQEEACNRCGNMLQPPRPLGIFQKVVAKVGYMVNQGQKRFVKPQANWIHVLLARHR